MADNFDINLKIFTGIADCQDQEEIDKLMNNIIHRFDPLTLNSFFQIATAAKSSTIPTLLLHNKISIEEAVRAARMDEDFQTESFGVVEGAHDLDEAYLYSVFSTAKSIINLCMCRDFWRKKK